jgi:thiamine biosynthesis protein ThiS
MDIVVNGAPHQLEAGANVVDLVAGMGLDLHRVAVEINRELVRRSTFEARRIEPGDRVEIVEFVGGG